MLGISSIFFLDVKGRIIITRHYRENVSNEVYEKFNVKLIEFDENSLKPIIQDKNNFYFHRRHNNIIILAVSQQQVNAVMIFTFLDVLIRTLTQYLKSLEEESVRDNFVLIYELLDEMMDNGYPQTTEFKILSEFIKTDSYQLESIDELKISSTLTNAVSWRAPGIKYKNNEIFLDVLEKINIIIDSNKKVIKSEIIGQIMAKSELSGMPECILGLNDKAYYELQKIKQKQTQNIDLTDIKFHQCVRLSKFENERVISFVPPDGDFELINYRIDFDTKSLFSVDVIQKPLKNKIDYYLKVPFFIQVRANYKKNCVASDVYVKIPISCDTNQVKFTHNIFGAMKIKYLQEENCLYWHIKNFKGQEEWTTSAIVDMTTIETEDRMNYKQLPIQIQFEIPHFTLSGIQVRFLKVTEQSGYKPWVRYCTSDGEYQLRSNV